MAESAQSPRDLPSAAEPRCWLLRVLRIGASACFAGWAWQHLVWSAPYDAILWNPDYMGWLARSLDVSWETYVAERLNDQHILFAQRIIGLIYLAMAVMCLTAKRSSRIQQWFLSGGSGLLLLLVYCLYVNAGSALPILVEFGGQILSPAVLILALHRGMRDRWTIAAAMVAFTTTFIGHGIYATGLAPTPGHFYGMVTGILGLGETGADVFLKTVGVLDFIVCAGILVPRMRLPCLAYAAGWGLLTALARPVAGMSLTAACWEAGQFVHEAVLRAPHVTFPLFLFLIFRSKNHKDATAHTR
ncbi:MAG: hypothetical protein AAF571_04740 [Verrucomicrobiota bacterium]